MIDWIVYDSDGEVVGKYRQHDEPVIPDDLTAERLSDGENLDDYAVSSWWMDAQ